MLSLTRKAGEKILIGDTIVVVISRIDGQSVKIGVQAPKEILILRGELNQNNNKYASHHQQKAI